MITLKDLGNKLTMIAVGTAVVFGIGYHPTVDAIIATVVWIFLVLMILGMLIAFVGIFAMSRADDEDVKKFYSDMAKAHRKSTLVSYILGALTSIYWLYGFVLHEWTGAAVVYVIAIMSSYGFLFMSKAMVKRHFIETLKGESA